jgi:hypothetical protein
MSIRRIICRTDGHDGAGTSGHKWTDSLGKSSGVSVGVHRFRPADNSFVRSIRIAGSNHPFSVRLNPVAADPGTLDQLMKAEQTIEARAATEMLPPLADAKKRVAAVEGELAAARAAVAALSAADRSAPACSAAQDPVSLSRFRRNPGGSCVALVRPNWRFFNPALPRSAPQIVAIAQFTSCFLPDARFYQIGGCPTNKRLLESLDKQALLAWLQ